MDRDNRTVEVRRADQSVEWVCLDEVPASLYFTRLAKYVSERRKDDAVQHIVLTNKGDIQVVFKRIVALEAKVARLRNIVEEQDDEVNNRLCDLEESIGEGSSASVHVEPYL